MAFPLELAGQKFGRLIALRIVGIRHKAMLWECRCDCGNIHLVEAPALKKGGVRSCGCLAREASIATCLSRITHGHSRGPHKSRTYSSYLAARKRCNYHKHERYHDYGGRGIEFRFTSFQQFLDELGVRPEGKTLDRIDNNGHYEVGNVRWATPKEQQANSRR